MACQCLVHTYKKLYMSLDFLWIRQFINKLDIGLQFPPQIRERGWPRASTINLGGGLNIRLSGLSGKNEERPATPEKLVGAILPLLPEGSTLLLEPGRSLVATAGKVKIDIYSLTSVFFFLYRRI